MSNCYKTNNSAVLAAYDKVKADKAAIAHAAKEFATHFNGTPLYSNSFGHFSFYGLTFTPAKDTLLWVSPARDIHTQWPRQSLRKGTKEQRAELKALQEEYASKKKSAFANAPKYADNGAVLKAMGLSEADMLFGGMTFFDHDGHLYLRTNSTPASIMTEILGSEYQQALKAKEGAAA